MQPVDYKSICEELRKIACDAGSFIRKERSKISEEDVELKSVASLVTYVDKETEKAIVKKLEQLIPDSGFITEEGTASHANERYKWIIDPLDGTTNYIHGITPHSVSIALMEEKEIVAGVVYEVGQDEMFYAWKDSPAYLNEKEIKVSGTGNLEDTLIGTGFPYYDFDRVEDYIDAMRYLMRHTRGLRRMGSAAVDIVYVAAGRFDAFYEHGLHPWDVAAGALILKQAGGKISDFNGGENWLFDGELIAGNSAIFDTFYQIIHKHLGK
ncbi:MAG: inositol monophosphatase family protein [Mariniphaga sp.]